MRTNLSRFTVAFSDLSWDSVIGDADLPMFPQARQVGLYLAAYAEQYIPKEVLRLGHRVIRTIRSVEADSTARWKVEWLRCIDQETSTEPHIEFEDFDFLVVASGYFARPYLPQIPGLENFSGQIIHSSALQKDHYLFSDTLGRGDIAVIGGSMSGVEAAAAAALRKSSAALSTNQRDVYKNRDTVHHVYSRPFWTLPTYLPQETSEETVSFLPLDLVMYDLGRRPPGPIDYALGPIPEEKAAKTNNYFKSLLGAEYEQPGHMHQPYANPSSNSRPPWVAIGNEYAEFVRSAAIKATMGRVVSGNVDDTGLASIKIQTSDTQSQELGHIAAIVMATGFTPFESLNFLPPDVLDALEYTTEDTFLPLVLDKGGTLRSEIPDVGFVGFYRGPYWGVMEMQARFLGEEWTGQYHKPFETGDQRESVRVLRHPDTDPRRGQFPMGDYVGLMESFAKDLGISRTEMAGSNGRSGPVVPARYVQGQTASASQTSLEAQRTLDDLQATLKPTPNAVPAGAALAIFRALHGIWRFRKVSSTGQPEHVGVMAFHPNYPSDATYDKEYVCEELKEIPGVDGKTPSYQTDWTFLRLSEASSSGNRSRIEVWSTAATAQVVAPGSFKYSLRLTPFYRKKKDNEYVPGEYVVYASIVSPDAAQEPTADPGNGYQYIFHFNGVSISKWERLDSDDDLSKNPLPCSRVVYER